jgi:hypothetical protein
MTVNINTVELDDEFEVLIYGHEHTPEDLKEEENVIESLMEEYDHLALEHLGYDKNLQAQTTTNFHSSEYTNQVMDLASRHFEEAWGPDSKSALPHYTLGVFVPLTIVYGTAIKKSYQWIKQKNDKHSNDEDSSDVDEEILSDHLIKINRREAMTGLLGLTGMYSIGFFDALQPDRIEKQLDNENVPFSFNYNDMREVYIAEGIENVAQSRDGSLMGIFGADHSDSIANYLENRESRKYKIDIYEEFLPEYQQKMAKWENKEGDLWSLEQTFNLSNQK